MLDYFAELQKRRVIRTLGWYVAVVLAGWQAADYVIPALGLPEWVMRVLVIGALAGLPVVAGLSWMFDVRRASARSDTDRSRSQRTVAVLAMIFMLLVSSVAGVQLLPRHSGAPAESSLGRLSVGVEAFFSGNLEEAVDILSGVAEDSSTPLKDRHEALRYIARSHLEADAPADAAATLQRLVELEPPMALMLPGVETDSLISLYYAARRHKLGRSGMAKSQSPVTAIEVLRFVGAGGGPALVADEVKTVAIGVSEVLITELITRLPSIKVVERRIPASQHRYDAYRYLESPDAAQIIVPSHVVIGSVAAAGDQILLSAYVIDVTTGALAHSAQTIVARPNLLYEHLVKLTDSLAKQIRASGV
jgi:TolB-like protein